VAKPALDSDVDCFGQTGTAMSSEALSRAGWRPQTKRNCGKPNLARARVAGRGAECLEHIGYAGSGAVNLGENEKPRPVGQVAWKR
jgi:hypothetical protein